MTIRHNINWKNKQIDPIQKVELEKFITGFITRVSMLEFENFIDVDVMLDHMVFKVRRVLLAEHPGPPSVDVTYPSTWWQHFKQHLLESQWCPLWARRLIRKYPVKYATRRVDVKVLYPTIQPQIPGKQHLICLYDRGVIDGNNVDINSDEKQRLME